MKKIDLLIYTLLLMTCSCSKNDKPTDPTKGAGLSATVSMQLGKTDSLSSFSQFFKATILTDDETSGGITVLAPSNNAFGNGQITSTTQLPDGSVSKDYIVKGVLKASDFTKGKTLTTLSGKILTINVVADPVVLVNGMVINTTAISTGNNFVVFGAAQLLNAPAPVFVTVWDATKWSSSKPKGELSVNAFVGLYPSPAAVAAGSNPTYTAYTGADGVAVFNGVTAGTYYVAASWGAANSLFSPYGETSNSIIGYMADTVIDNTGKVVYIDVNQDGRIDGHDMVTVPGLPIHVTNEKPIDMTILIGQIYPTIQTYAAAQAKLDAVYAGLTTMYQDLLIMDGALSDDADCAAAGSAYCPFDNFSMTPNTAVLSSIWNDAYFNNLNKINYLIRDVGGLSDATAPQKAQMKAEALVLRDYIYLELMTYFGDIPAEADLGNDFYPSLARSTSASIMDAILPDLNSQYANLPATRTDGKQGLTKYAALGLAVKAALLKKDYNSVSANCLTIKASSAFSLAPSGYSWLTNQNTSETIWAPNFSTITTANAGYFSGAFGAVTAQWCPVLRYAEILLSDAEAQIALGNLSGAATDINMLRARSGLGPLTFATAGDATTALQSTWKTEMYRQGGRYANLMRWGATTAQGALGGNWHTWNALMPLPISFLSAYPNMIQNPSY